MQLGDIVFSYLSKPEVVEKPPTPISDKEIGALNYLSGYVVFKLLKKIRNSSKFNSFENQQFLNILECTLDKKGGNELIDRSYYVNDPLPKMIKTTIQYMASFLYFICFHYFV